MSETGVVDPIRIPPWIREPAQRWWREMPPLARVFVGLTVLDVVGRSIGLLAPTIAWGYMTPLYFVAAFVPHDLWILLPALLLIRRPDAAIATPWVYRGAIVVAAVELARVPIRALLEPPSGLSAISALEVGAAGVGLLVAWVLLARGLAALTPREPSATVARVANLAVAALGILAALYLAEVLVAPPVDVTDPALNQAMTISSLVAPLQTLGWAYLVWVVIRGVDDSRRPRAATMTAGAGAMLAAFVVPLVSVVGRLLGAFGFNPSDGSGLGEVYLIVSWLGDSIGPTLIALAFALGLAEPAAPYLTEPVPAGDARPLGEPAPFAEPTATPEPPEDGPGTAEAPSET